MRDAKNDAPDGTDSNNDQWRCVPDRQKYKPYDRETEIHRCVDRTCPNGLKHQKEKRSMEHFAGLDVSVNETSVCIVDDTGRM